MISTASAEDALARLRDEKVDIVFSDVMMPGMSGIELARMVRAQYPALPVLLASGYSEEMLEGAAREFDVIRKPYGAEALASQLAKALHGRG